MARLGTHLGVILHGIRRRVRRLCHQPTVFYLEYESLTPEAGAVPPPKLEEWRIDWVDLDTLSALPPRMRARGVSDSKFQEDLERGCRCLGLFQKGELVAFSWVDLRRISSRLLRTALREDEAYLYYMLTDSSLRGMGIAPFLRAELYRRLEAMGRTNLYSITECSNKASLRFKSKLGVRHLACYLRFKAFRKQPFRICLRRYPDVPRFPLMNEA